MFINPLKRVFIVKNLVLHKLDLILHRMNTLDSIMNQHNQRLLELEELEKKSLRLVNSEIENFKQLLESQTTRLINQQENYQQLLESQTTRLINQQENQNVSLSTLLSQMAEQFFDDDKFAESLKFYECALSLQPTNQNLINKTNLVKKIRKLPVDWSDPNYCYPNEAYYPTIPPINIELSSHCNLKCPYCANATLERDYEKMEKELIEIIADQCQSLNLQITAVHGVGEPLLRRDLEEILNNFRTKGIWKGVLTSNCTLLSLERMKSLYESGVTYIYNSLDTIDPDLYRQTRGGDLYKTIDNVKVAARNFPDVTFCVGLMNHKKQVITSDVQKEFWEIFKDLPNIRLSVYENGLFPGSGESWTRYDFKSEVCYSPAFHFTIDARGKVAVCCADQNTEHVLGDIRQQNIAEIWYNRENQETFRNLGLGLHGCPDVCYKCKLKPTSRKIDDVEPILYAPINKILVKAEECFLDTHYAESQRLYSHALKRDPYNDQIKAKLEEVIKLTGISDDNFVQDFLSSL